VVGDADKQAAKEAKKKAAKFAKEAGR
jgi:hypothetical protein